MMRYGPVAISNPVKSPVINDCKAAAVQIAVVTMVTSQNRGSLRGLRVNTLMPVPPSHPHVYHAQKETPDWADDISDYQHQVADGSGQSGLNGSSLVCGTSRNACR
jgi:hypothetical protein